MNDDDVVRQVVVHPAAWDSLVAWLESRGIRLAHIPLEDDLPTYVMVPEEL